MNKGLKNGLLSTLIAISPVLLSAPTFAATHHASSMNNMNNQMAEVKILTPSQGNTVPSDHYVVDIQIVVPKMYASQIKVQPAFVTPTSKYFKPGSNYYFPELVVTDTGSAKKIGGPMRNIAGLFQIIGEQTNLSGDLVINADWFVGKPLFSSVSMPCIEAYIVKGTAPSMVSMSPTNMDIGKTMHAVTLISNVAKTDFYTGAVSSSSSSGM